MANKDYKVFIVEGEVREPMIIDTISNVFFNQGNYKIITLPAGQNIYMLWKKLCEDDFETDIIEVLRESNEEILKKLDRLSRNDFSEIYLFFDYDAHQTNLEHECDEDIVKKMLDSFDNETENGKLYISYPMVEALRDFWIGECGVRERCFVDTDKFINYKEISSQYSSNPHFKEYDFNVWKDVIDIFAMKVSCLLGMEQTICYEHYSQNVTPMHIYEIEKNLFQNGRVFVLSAFPEFLVDYFGEKLWRTCSKHGNNQIQECKVHETAAF